MKIALLLLIPLFMIGNGCHHQARNVKENFVLDAPFDLQTNERIASVEEELSLFWKSTKDRRCPETEVCKDKGEATLYFEIIKGKNKGNLKFSIPGQCFDQTGKCGDTVEWANYIISIIYLSSKSETNQFRLRMKVVNKNNSPI